MKFIIIFITVFKLYSAQFTLESEEFYNNGLIPVQFTQNGKNYLPTLRWRNAPEKTKSFVLIVEEENSKKVHLLLYKMHKETIYIDEKTDLGTCGIAKNDFGNFCYDGPCHENCSQTKKYVFKLYALDKIINGSKAVTAIQLKRDIRNHILAEAVLIGKYSRN